MIDAAEVAKHDSADSCWVIVEGYVYDVTDFLQDHPGGPQSILRLAGQVRSALLYYRSYSFSRTQHEHMSQFIQKERYQLYHQVRVIVA